MSSPGSQRFPSVATRQMVMAGQPMVVWCLSDQGVWGFENGLPVASLAISRQPEKWWFPYNSQQYLPLGGASVSRRTSGWKLLPLWGNSRWRYKNGRYSPVLTLSFGPKTATGSPILTRQSTILPVPTLGEFEMALQKWTFFIYPYTEIWTQTDDRRPNDPHLTIRDLASEPTAKRKVPDLELFEVISTPLAILFFHCVHYRTHNNIKLTYTFSSRNRFH